MTSRSRRDSLSATPRVSHPQRPNLLFTGDPYPGGGSRHRPSCHSQGDPCDPDYRGSFRVLDPSGATDRRGDVRSTRATGSVPGPTVPGQRQEDVRTESVAPPTHEGGNRTKIPKCQRGRTLWYLVRAFGRNQGRTRTTGGCGPSPGVT